MSPPNRWTRVGSHHAFKVKPAHQSSASEQVARIVDGGDGSFTVTQAADAAMATLHNEVLLHSSVLHLSTMLKSLTSGLFAENLIF